MHARMHTQLFCCPSVRLYVRPSVHQRPGTCNLSDGCHAMGALEQGKPRLSQIEATYRQTTKPDSRNRGLLAHGGDSSRFLSGSRVSPSCCVHAFYTQSRIFRNFSACLVFPKLVFCSAKGGLVGLVLGGHNSGSFGLIACAVGPFGLPKWLISPTGNRRAPTAAGCGPS